MVLKMKKIWKQNKVIKNKSNKKNELKIKNIAKNKKNIKSNPKNTLKIKNSSFLKSKQIEFTFKQGVINNREYTLKPIDSPIKLNQNESPFDLPNIIKKKIIKTLTSGKWNIYPEFIPEKLLEKIASYYNLDKTNILLGNGSNEMIFTLFASTLEIGKKVIISQPTFTIYNLIASNLNADIRHIPLKFDFSYNIEKILKEVKTPRSVCIIANPNNPTGTYLTLEELKKIIKSSYGIVIIDEAYIHFGGESVLKLINEYDNLIVLRTFSKAFGLAGLRIGMLFSNKNIIKQLLKVKLPYNLNIFTLITLDTIFDNLSYVDFNIKLILEEKKKVGLELLKIEDLKVIPSAANFFLVKVKDSRWLFDRLLEFGILVRDVSYYPMLENCLRISIGNKKENEILIKALRKIYGCV